MGIQNSPGSTLMTVADMSVITAEVQVDETDIVNVKLDQPAEVTIDALPNQTFKGKVTEIGDNAIIRSTGVSTSQSTGGTQEAKDFKVVVTLLDPPPNLRPGLSTTAKITTGTAHDAVAIPIQALTVRDKTDLEAEAKKKAKPADNNAPAAAATAKKENNDVQGVFVVKDNKVEFHPVETGLTGSTEIEVKKGLDAGDVIITGSYKVLKTIRNGTAVKIDNSLANKAST
jgi:HlyD family secretion protein